MTALDQALKIRPDYFDAMEYQNLLWREKAKFEKDEKAKHELSGRRIWWLRRLWLFV